MSFLLKLNVYKIIKFHKFWEQRYERTFSKSIPWVRYKSKKLRISKTVRLRTILSWRFCCFQTNFILFRRIISKIIVLPSPRWHTSFMNDDVVHNQKIPTFIYMPTFLLDFVLSLNRCKIVEFFCQKVNY